MNFSKFFGAALACSFFASTIAGAMDSGFIFGDKIPNGNYFIISAKDQGKVMDVEGGSMENRANVRLWNKNGTLAQVFYLNNLPNGNCTLMNSNSGKMLDVDGGEAFNDANIHQYETNLTSAQQWRIKHFGGRDYELRSDINNNMVADLENGKTTNGTNIRLWKKNGTKAQLWNFQKAII